MWLLTLDHVFWQMFLICKLDDVSCSVGSAGSPWCQGQKFWAHKRWLAKSGGKSNGPVVETQKLTKKTTLGTTENVRPFFYLLIFSFPRTYTLYPRMGDFIYNAGDSKQQQLFPYGTTPPHSSSTSPPLQFMPSDDDQGDISMLTDQSCWQNPAALTNPASCDLQDILLYYRSQPELLRLILLSKVEEDKRRTEEARLRAKELDMLLLQQQQELVANGLATADPTSLLSQQQQQQQLFATSDTKTVTTTAGPTSSPQTIPRRSSSALGYPDEPVPGLEDPNAFSPTTTLSSSSTPNSFLHLARYAGTIVMANHCQD